MRPGSIVLVAAALLASVPALAYEVDGFSGKSGKAGIKDFLPRCDAEENRNNKFYSEQYSFNAELEDDHDLWFQIFISNMGVANGRAALQLHFTPKGKSKIKDRALFEQGKWSYGGEGDKLKITLGENVFVGGADGWTGHFETERLLVDLTVKNLVPAWKPGGGGVYYGAARKNYYDVTLLTPRGSIEADVTVKETGEKVHVTGRVTGDRSASNLSPNLLARRWVKLRLVGKSHTIMMTNLQTSEEYGDKWTGWFFVASDKAMLAAGTNPTVELADTERDAEAGYDVPRIVLLSGGAGVEGFTGAIKGLKRTHRHDQLADLSAIEKAVVSKLVKPISYGYRSEFELQFESGGKSRSYKGKATYTYEQLTK
ncbi:MAG: hypothetical protein FJ109_06655 [Deltaproteobacteria bacterium]|nr:hypothetical protein [Deltaproteobacteria bacterium]